MTYDQLKAAIGTILSNAAFGRDNYGQIIIYTGLCKNELANETELVEMDDA